MVFMTMRQNDGANELAILLEVGNVGNDEIDAEEFGFGEHHARVDNDDVVAVAKRHHVHAKFTETAQRNSEKGLQRLAQRDVSSKSCSGKSITVRRTASEWRPVKRRV